MTAIHPPTLEIELYAAYFQISIRREPVPIDADPIAMLEAWHVADMRERFRAALRPLFVPAGF